jgi:hypothetical protein
LGNWITFYRELKTPLLEHDHFPAAFFLDWQFGQKHFAMPTPQMIK